MVAIFCKRPQLLHQSIVLLHENARHHTPNWTAVYGCTSDTLWISPNLVLSVLSLTESLRSTLLAMVAVDADVKQGIASRLQTLESNVFTLDYEPWYQCGVNVEMAVVSLLRSDVYHLFHMCHVLIKVTIRL